MKSFPIFAAILLLAIPLALAQQKDSKPVETTKPSSTSLPEAVQVKVLKAERAKKQAEADIAVLEADWRRTQAPCQTSPEAKAIQEKAPAAEAKVAKAQADFKAEQDAALKSIGLDPEKYTLDEESLTPKAKARATEGGEEVTA